MSSNATFSLTTVISALKTAQCIAFAGLMDVVAACIRKFGFEDSRAGYPPLQRSSKLLVSALQPHAPPLMQEHLTACVAEYFVADAVTAPPRQKLTCQVLDGYWLPSGDIEVRINDGLHSMVVRCPPSHGLSIKLAVKDVRVGTFELQYAHAPVPNQDVAYIMYNYIDVTADYVNARAEVGAPKFLKAMPGVSLQGVLEQVNSGVPVADVAAQGGGDDSSDSDDGDAPAPAAGGGGAGGGAPAAVVSNGDNQAGAPDNGQNYGFQVPYNGTCTHDCGNGKVQTLDPADGSWLGASYDYNTQTWVGGDEHVGFRIDTDGQCLKDFIGQFPPLEDIVPDAKFATTPIGQMQNRHRRCVLFWYVATQLLHCRGAHVRCRLAPCIMYWIRSLYPNPAGVPYTGFEYAELEYAPPPPLQDQYTDADSDADSEDSNIIYY